MSYIILRGRWCDIVLHVHAPTENKTDDMNNFYEELERVYHTNILLEDFNAKVGREDTCKRATGNESLHEISNHKRVRVVNCRVQKFDTFHISFTFALPPLTTLNFLGV
jgi:hypothetical protein